MTSHRLNDQSGPSARPKRGNAGLLGQRLQAEQENIDANRVQPDDEEDEDDLEMGQPSKPTNARKRSTSRGPAKPRKKAKKAAAAPPVIATHLISAQVAADWQRSHWCARGRGGAPHVCYHAEWKPADAKLGEKITKELIPVLKAGGQVECRHCGVVKPFNPSTRDMEHSVLHCPAFQKTATYKSKPVQDALQRLQDAAVKKKGVSCASCL